ncbi:flavin monoamine oxidase family protein [Rubrivirga sp. IMCC45206]|uniref:flavin monoamine oxidase family protein n=1 Tax=Rubrivirga sp. IMCC45206 TaxID=3391614 RepID=UPI0039900B7F
MPPVLSHVAPVGQADCVVVGAGFAGLAAAADLEAAGLSVLLLDARDRVGGRTEAGALAGQTVDLGGMWAGPTQTALLELADRLGVATFPTPLDGRSRGRLGDLRFEAHGEAFEDEIGLVSKVRLGLLVHKLGRLLRHVDAEAPWQGARAAALDRETVASWAAREVGDRTVRRLLDFVVRSVFCAEPDDLSLLFFLFYLKAAGGLEVLIQAGPGGAQNLLFHGGLHQLAVRMHRALAAETRLEEPVVAVHSTDDGVEVVTSAGRHRSAHVVVAVPPALCAGLAFSPALPARRRALLARQVTGTCIKVWVAYRRPFWRDAGLNGGVADDTRPFSPVYDATPPGAPVGLLAGFFDGEAAVAWSERTPEERQQEVVATLAEHLGPEAHDPVGYAERDWTREPWSRGCYGAYLPPGALSKYGSALRAPHGRVHWAGTETASVWSGYVEGAIRSGRRAAAEVVAARSAMS